MRKLKRLFKSGILNHCFQRSADGGVIFYSQSDYLIWFTTVCTAAQRHKVKVLSMCPMPDHTHMSVTAETVQELSAFYGEANRTFSRSHNQVCGTRMSWFESTYGSVPKQGAKAGRTNLIYVGNNAVERQLAVNAEDYRWSFLAYAVSDHPFSDKLVLREASWHMKNAVREVRAQHKRGKPLTYNQLRRITSKLDLREREQLVDFIITTYNIIDYTEALRYFDGSFENYLVALHSTTTHEYDLNETFEGRSDAWYAQMAQILIREKRLPDIHEFLSWPLEKRKELYPLLRNRTRATPGQICKFLHIPKVKA
jgi:REP element-mobilizing transposase RayT